MFLCCHLEIISCCISCSGDHRSYSFKANEKKVLFRCFELPAVTLFVSVPGVVLLKRSGPQSAHIDIESYRKGRPCASVGKSEHSERGMCFMWRSKVQLPSCSLSSLEKTKRSF